MSEAEKAQIAESKARWELDSDADVFRLAYSMMVVLEESNAETFREIRNQLGW